MSMYLQATEHMVDFDYIQEKILMQYSVCLWNSLNVHRYMLCVSNSTLLFAGGVKSMLWWDNRDTGCLGASLQIQMQYKDIKV
jgi:hypothetical protein